MTVTPTEELDNPNLLSFNIRYDLNLLGNIDLPDLDIELGDDTSKENHFVFESTPPFLGNLRFNPASLAAVSKDLPDGMDLQNRETCPIQVSLDYDFAEKKIKSIECKVYCLSCLELNPSYYHLE